MQTKTYNIYTYDELDDKAKEKARDWYTSTNDYSFLSEVMNEHAEYLLTDAKFTSINIKRVPYSLSCSQGDGAMIEFTANYEHGDNAYTVTIKNVGHYCHCYSSDYDISDYETGDDANSDVYEHVKKLCVGIFKDLEKFGYSQIECEDSEENVAEIMSINEYTFLQDGTRHD